MSKHEMKKFNIKSIRDLPDGVKLICSNDNDEWLLKADFTLLHRDNRNSRGNVSFHYQRNVKSFHHALDYIKGHSQKLYKKPKKVCRMEYLFSII